MKDQASKLRLGPRKRRCVCSEAGQVRQEALAASRAVADDGTGAVCRDERDAPIANPLKNAITIFEFGGVFVDRVDDRHAAIHLWNALLRCKVRASPDKDRQRRIIIVIAVCCAFNDIFAQHDDETLGPDIFRERRRRKIALRLARLSRIAV